jgi:hypothetical protein
MSANVAAGAKCARIARLETIEQRGHEAQRPRADGQPDYFDMLGVRAAHGRVFTPDDDLVAAGDPASDYAAVLICSGCLRRVTGADERADGVPQVLRERREEREAALVAVGLDGLGDAAELAQRQVTCLLGRHALAHVLVHRLGDVPVDFGAQLAFALCAASLRSSRGVG